MWNESAIMRPNRKLCNIVKNLEVVLVARAGSSLSIKENQLVAAECSTIHQLGRLEAQETWSCELAIYAYCTIPSIRRMSHDSLLPILITICASFSADLGWKNWILPIGGVQQSCSLRHCSLLLTPGRSIGHKVSRSISLGTTARRYFADSKSVW